RNSGSRRSITSPTRTRTRAPQTAQPTSRFRVRNDHSANRHGNEPKQKRLMIRPIQLGSMNQGLHLRNTAATTRRGKANVLATSYGASCRPEHSRTNDAAELGPDARGTSGTRISANNNPRP